MHPTRFLRGSQARFTDPSTGELVQPGSVPHAIEAFVMAAVRAGFRLSDVAELTFDADFGGPVPTCGQVRRLAHAGGVVAGDVGWSRLL